MTRIYLSGAMSGLPALNYPAFNAAAAALRDLGFLVENPPEPPCGTWTGYMRMALRQISRADALVMLEGWERSRGARIERGLAVDLGLPVWTLEHALRQGVPA